ncbi:MAG TPA: hypothetical protein VEW66_07365, partial [Thermomicrobiales bacterium]|nr:hypothetical protein [Thermomicrobiales bacterium]
MRARSFQAFLVFLSVLMMGAMVPTVAQDEGTPPLIEPSDGEGQGNGGTLETNFELGNGGQPAEFPREIVVDGARFLFDRMVPASRQELVPVANEAEIQAFATTETAPFDAIYLSVPPRNEDELGRYLPEQIGSEQVSCPSEAADYGQLDVSGTIYLFAGIETFLTADDLQQVGNDSNGQPVYADPGTEQPFPELFLPDPNGLARLVLTAESGAPVTIAESLAIEGTQFAFEAEVTGQVDPGTLTKIGCAGPFAVYGEADAASGTRYAMVGDRVFQYTGEAPVAAATEVPATPEPTAEPTEVPATPEPTAEPSLEPTVEPTEIPATPEPTVEPTLEPTAEPTEVPPTPEPTQAPTEAPADAPPATPDAATEAPAPTDVPEGDDATAVPTVAVPAEVVDAATGADAPAQVEVNNTTYYFAQTDVDIDISTLVEVDVITVNDIELTVYAEQELSGVAPSIYCLDNEGRLVGQYVPA